MCQLLYANLKDSYLNSLVIFILQDIGVNTGPVKNDDGTGFITTDNKVWKSMLAANKIINMGEILFKNIENGRAVPAHIRAASFGIEVNKENSHPFDGKHFILMHNGTLVPRDGKEPKDKKKDSDSLKFLKALDDEKENNPKGKFPDIFNKAMENFAGKFAFIIREKETNKDYIIRGRTADLYISNLLINDEFVGYVIDTNKDTMKQGFPYFINIAQLTTGNEYKFSEPTLLKQETIFWAKDNGIKELGDAKEFTPPIPEPVSKINYNDRTESSIVPFQSKSKTTIGNNTKEIAELINLSGKIHDFLKSNSLSLVDLQFIFKQMSNCSLLEVTKNDLVLFVDYLITKLAAKKAIRKQVRNILNGKSFPLSLYGKYNLEYPWTLNPGDVILKLLREEVKAVG